MTTFTNLPEDIIRKIAKKLPPKEIKKFACGIINKNTSQLDDIYLKKLKKKDISIIANNLCIIIKTRIYDYQWSQPHPLPKWNGGEISKIIHKKYRIMSRFLITRYKLEYFNFYNEKSIKKWNKNRKNIRKQMINILEKEIPYMIELYEIKF